MTQISRWLPGVQLEILQGHEQLKELPANPLPARFAVGDGARAESSGMSSFSFLA